MNKAHHLEADERLLILRAADQFRAWKSLDDRRVCTFCDRTFTGRQVEISVRRNGRFEIHCPTEGCKSLPRQWAYPGNPLTSETSYADWLRAVGGKAPPVTPMRTAFSRA